MSESERDKFRIKEPFGGKNMLDRDSKGEGEREREKEYLSLPHRMYASDKLKIVLQILLLLHLLLSHLPPCPAFQPAFIFCSPVSYTL